MKELSLEEKAKRYDEAIGRANDILKGYNPKEGSKATINYIFPEFHEDKDERIMTALTHFFSNSENTSFEYWEGISKKEVLDWLEKQGQKSAWSEDYELSYFESTLFTAFSDAWQSYLQGKEVNVKQWVKEHSKELLEAAKDELEKQKPVWSEEDEKRFKSCLNILQPKTLLGNTETINTKWFKSLKERYIWKPSDEQMDSLEYIIDNIQHLPHSYSVAKKLLEELKKLKG